MKLNEILKPSELSPAVREYFKKYQVGGADNVGRHKEPTLELLYFKDGKLVHDRPGYGTSTYLSIGPKTGPLIPWEKFPLEIDGHPFMYIKFNNIIFDDLIDLPVASLHFTNCIFKSFKGVDTLKNEISTFQIYNEDLSRQKPVGILSLAKLSTPDGCAPNVEYMNTDGKKLQDILVKYYWRDLKTIVELQSELIDAGLDEYAKL